MRQLAKKILERILRFLAKRVLARYRPFVIAITGSVGKTTTKEMVTAVVKESGSVWASRGNYNTEIGVPLSIFGQRPTSIFGWPINILKATWLAFGAKNKNYPDKLVLEMGADKPGDLKYLTSFAKPNIAIVTKVSPVHAEFFGGLDSTAEEKGQLAKAVDKDGFVILNYDDKKVRAMKEITEAKILFYGLQENAAVKGYGIEINTKGTTFTFDYENERKDVILNNFVGEHFVYAALAAISVGISLGLSFDEIVKGLANARPLPHRLNLIKGIKGSTIIDDTYNASAPSVLEALKVLGKIKGNFRIAILGDMLELGEYSESEHRKVGKRVPESAHLLIVVGEQSKFTAAEALKNGLTKDKVFFARNSAEAIPIIKENLQEKDVVLVKGSRGIRMEEIVEEIRG